MRYFWIALQFFTRLPAPQQHDIESIDLGRSVLTYPLVGVVIGLLLLAVAWLTSTMSSWVSAALIVTAWVAITGALHLDGLADSADAWLGGYGDREKTMAIMKDPYCGPAGVVVLILTLLLKFTLLLSLLESSDWLLIFLAPVLARGLVLALLMWTPYARADGIGALHSGHLPQQMGQWVLIAVALFTLLLLGISAVWMLMALAGLFYLLRQIMLQRLGGTTGDTAGALVEIIEVSALLLWVI